MIGGSIHLPSRRSPTCHGVSGSWVVVIYRLADLTMTPRPCHYLLEGVPTCHSEGWILWSCWMLRCGPMNPCALLLANRRREPWDPKVEIDSRSVGRIMGGLRGGSESIFRLGDLHMEPPATQSPCFVYLQANNDIYMWNQVICT